MYIQVLLLDPPYSTKIRHLGRHKLAIETVGTIVISLDRQKVTT